MPTRPVRSLIDHVRRAVPPAGDGELLGRFVDRRDEGALAALVDRHGPMVWGVCRRLLSHHDAEDACQATFIVLVRKAGSIRPREMVGNWLYGVACQAAVQARAATRRRERQVDPMPDAAAPQDRWADVRPILDEELGRLPGHYRAVIVLSDLEGMTRRDVAARLGCPEGTVASRLVRARAMLAKRLSGRGVALSSATVASVLTQNAVSAAVPASVVTSTIKAASLCAAGQAAVSPHVAALTEGVLKAMLVSKLKSVAVMLVVAAVIGTLGFGLALGQQNGDPAAPQKPASDKAPKEAVVKENDCTAWGKEVGGLRAGLEVKEKRPYRLGETVTLLVRVRNVGKQSVKFEYIRQYLDENPPDVTGADGKGIPQGAALVEGESHDPVAVSLEPGKEVVLETRIHGTSGVPYELRPADGGGQAATKRHPLRVGTGKVTVQYERVFGNSSAGKIKIDPVLSKLATGALELEVKEADDKKPVEPAAKQEKEAFTAWGNEIGGLQAGLGYKAGEKRAYSHGETVTLVVRVRNVGKETVGFQYLRSFFAETPPAVTTAEGKLVIHATVKTLDQKELPVDVSLAPGKEVELAELKYEFRGGIDMGTWQGPFSHLYATGKLGFQYPQVLGNSSLGKIKIDPDLLKLRTGKLELEVKDKPSGVKTAYPSADIEVLYRDGSGRDSKQFRVEDAEAVATLASHLPGILGEKGRGPKASAGNRATITIKFNHTSGEVSQMRVAHVTADYATWWWRDNTPYTGDRQVEQKDELKGLMERLAGKAKIDLK